LHGIGFWRLATTVADEKFSQTEEVSFFELDQESPALRFARRSFGWLVPTRGLRI